MSLLLKALKQAETAHAGKSGGERPASAGDDALELEPMAGSSDAEPTAGWVEPPGLLFGGAAAAAAAPRPARHFRWPQLSLVPAVALAAGVIAIGYGIYLYLALQPPDTAFAPPAAGHPAPPAPAAQPPVVATVAPVTEPPVAAPDPLPPAPAGLDANVAPAAPVRRVEPPAPALLTPPAARATTPSAPRREPDTAAGRPPSAAVDTRARPAPAAGTLQFQPDAQSTLLSQAHAAYERGALAEAQRLYTRAAARNRGVDAVLGLAAIAVVQNRDADAQRLYRDVLDIDPRNATAQAALLDLLGTVDAPATESRLKALIEREPSPQLYQTLGNLYADQQRWNDAQAAYYEAYRLAPDNADYAFNLAVSLDQLRQIAAASKYYEKALATGGVHRFDRAQAAARLKQLQTGR